MKKAAAFLLAVCLFLFSYSDTVYGEPKKTNDTLALNAKSAVLLDGDSGRILYQKDGQEILPMASTTKIMTCIVALEQGNLEDIVTVSSYAAGQPQVHLGMRSGQQFYLKDLLHSLMLESHNDSAVAIAEHIAGSVENFAMMMNEKAEELGCSHTYFITPNGLDAQTTGEDGTARFHSTTAEDLARIMKYCAWESDKKEEFLSITRAASYQFTDVAQKASYFCGNHNAFLNMMNGALTGKTGFTGTAGYCYVGALEKDGKKLVAVVLACGWPPHKTYKWSDVKKLMNYGLTEYEKRTVGTDGKISVSIPVVNGKSEFVMAETDFPKKEFLLKPSEQIELSYSLSDSVLAPVKEGEEVGSLTYMLGGDVLYSQPFTVKNEIPVQDMSGKLWNFWYRLTGQNK